MNIRHASALLICALLGLPVSSAPLDDQVARVMAQSPVADGHADTVLQIFPMGVDIGVDLAGRQADLPKLRAGGVGLQTYSIFTDPGYGAGVVARTHFLIDVMRAHLSRHPNQIEQVYRSGDLARLREQGKIAAVLSIEGGHALGRDQANLEVFYKKGVRSLTLTWMHDNAWADSSTDSGRWGGLSPQGERLVRRMNALGMVVDVSHTADATVRDVLRVSKAPIIASHSSCWALSAHPRNLQDDLLRAIAAKGGVVAINFFPNYLDDRYRRLHAGLEGYLNGQRKALYARYAKDPRRVERFAPAWRKVYVPTEAVVARMVTVSRVADHIDHAVKVAGVDHVGLGSDFDGAAVSPGGLEDASKYPNLARELLRRGYKQDDVIKILGGNLRRVYEQVLPQS